MSSSAKKITAKVIVLVLCGVVSFFLLGRIASDSGAISKNCRRTLDEKKENVLALTGVTAGASLAISVIPGDTGNSIADKLADMSGYFVAITIAIYIEQWLIAITGLLAFKIIIPAACLIFIANIFLKWETLQKLTVKVLLFSLVLYLVVPFSVWVSGRIDAVSDRSVSERTESIQKDADELTKDSGEESDDDENAVQRFFSKVSGGVTAVKEKFNTLVKNMVDVIAAMIVTSCVIPVLVFLLLMWFSNTLFGTAFQMPVSTGINKNMPHIGAGSAEKTSDGTNGIQS